MLWLIGQLRLSGLQWLGEGAGFGSSENVMAVSFQDLRQFRTPSCAQVALVLT